MGRLMHEGRVEATSGATPEQVWAIISDVTRIGEWSHECRTAEWLGDAKRATPGARFRGGNKLGRMAWSRQNEIVAADAPHLLAWRTVPTRLYNDQTEWRISIERDSDVTTIVQTFEVLKLGPVMERLFHLLIPAHRDRMDALRDDMRRLASVAEAVELEPVT
jgi:hypothetical protein